MSADNNAPASTPVLQASDGENSVTVYIKGYQPPTDGRFAGSIGRHIAELDAPVLASKAHRSLRRGLEQLARSLLAQYNKQATDWTGDDSSVRVVGISIKAIEFSFIFDVRSKDGDER